MPKEETIEVAEKLINNCDAFAIILEFYIIKLIIHLSLLS